MNGETAGCLTELLTRVLSLIQARCLTELLTRALALKMMESLIAYIMILFAVYPEATTSCKEKGERTRCEGKGERGKGKGESGKVRGER